MCINLIYRLVNKVNNKVYVGQTWDSLKDRWDNGWGYRSCTYLQRAIKKYGKNNFRYELLVVTHTQEMADYWEEFFIRKHGSRNPNLGYNIRGGGSRGKFTHSQETKDKIAKSKLGKKLTAEHKRKISLSVSGPLSPNYKRPKTPEQLRKQSISMSGENNPHYGKPRPQETRERISKAQSGEKSFMAKLSKDDVIKIINFLKLGTAQREIAIMFGVSQSTINNIHMKKSWKEIER